MLNINESMWRDSASAAASMTKGPPTNAWGTTDMALQSRRSQFSSGGGGNVSNNENPGAAINTNGGSSNNAASSAANESGRLKFMFSPEDMTETVLFGGPPSQKIGGLEDAMERLSMVSSSKSL